VAPPRWIVGWVTPVLLLVASSAHALVGEPSYVSFQYIPRGAELVGYQKPAAPLWIDEQDFPAVQRAARDLQADIKRVTHSEPKIETSATAPTAPVVVIAGTLGHSRVLDGLVASRKLDVRAIAGKWESFLVEVLEQPLPGVERAIVIAGSDRRGTIYGLYDLSEQIGVSPWYWWADVPVRTQTVLYVKPVRTERGEPVVKYRGIFLNDEAPAMSGWAKEKFGGFNHEMYGHVFELILRLRGNYIWPAMWGNAFLDDDPKNAALAEEYGIVLGTSHHEPMMRAHDEWRRYGSGDWDYSTNQAKLREFWRSGVERVRDNEKLVTVGMRGDGDKPMSADANVSLLEKIVADQRSILADITHKPAAETPQVWALYKEVQEYYERGMRVPDDVTLLWSDDNWGNIRRLPLPAERARAGGAGIYYHFDYVGGPRNYKWINTVPITKIWEQMNLAWAYGATRIWIANVGDLKPLEFPIDFFLTLAWNPARWSQDSLHDYAREWSARQFGEQRAERIAKVLEGYTKLNSRRKPEMLEPDTFSLTNYAEAERVLQEWLALRIEADEIYCDMTDPERAAFFELVAYPVKAATGIQQLYVATGRNRLYASQGRRAEARKSADFARELYTHDQELVRDYHKLWGGKWNHMMSQAKLGYTSWQQPDVETPPALSVASQADGASMGITFEGDDRVFPTGDGAVARLPRLDPLQPSALIQAFSRATYPFELTVSSPQSWLSISGPPALMTSDQLISVSVPEWSKVPVGESVATVKIEATTGQSQILEIPVFRPAELPPHSFRGFVESDRHIAIEAPHFNRAVNSPGVKWQVLPDFGRTLGGVTTFPVMAPEAQPAGKNAARLDYDVWLFSTGEMQVELQLAPSLDFQGGDGLRFAVSFDDESPQIIRLGTAATPQDWARSVSENIRRVSFTQTVSKPGPHTFKFWRVTPGVVLERIVIDAGGVRPSYLGPPESARWPVRGLR
jgi:glycosyl hydrolase family 115 (putative glucuronidase)/glycosyl hydrolase family 115